MKKLVYIFGLLVLISGCASHKFVISTDEPDGLKIELNGKYKGTTYKDTLLTFSTNLMTIDNYKIEAKNEEEPLFYGYIEYGYVGSDSIRRYVIDSQNAIELSNEVLTNSITTRKINFFRQEQINNEKNKFGYVKLTSNQKDVDIYIDNALFGKIKDDKPFNKKIPTGNHIIMAKKEFFMPYTINIEIMENDIFPFHFKLQNVKGWVEETPGSSTIRQARGNLTVATERNDYKIYIEGYEKIPPFELKDMPAGKYSLRIVRPGFEKIISVRVNDGEDKFVDLDELLKNE